MEAIYQELHALLRPLSWSCNFQRVWKWTFLESDQVALNGPDLTIEAVIRYWANTRQLTLEEAIVQLARAADVITEHQAAYLRSKISPPSLSAVPCGAAVSERTPRFENLKLSLPGERPISFRRLATPSLPCQLLQAFEKRDWAKEIPSPFSGAKGAAATHNAVHRLNRQIGVPVFFAANRGSIVGWQLPSASETK